MTSFELELGGQVRAVSIEASGPDRYRVIIHRLEDGAMDQGQGNHAYDVQAVRVGEFGLSMIVGQDDDRTDNRETAIRDVQVAPGRRGEVLVSLGGRTVAVTVNGRRRGRTVSDAGGQAAGAQSIVAPMPGRVVRVLVGPGDHVAVRQPVIVVEAMKMENELRAPKAGTVKDVTVTAGTSVEAGRVLMIVE